MLAPRVVVVGAGVIGLTAAATLLEAGASVLVVDDNRAGARTLDLAGAYWRPHPIPPLPASVAWSHVTRSKLLQLSADPATGILPLPLRILQRQGHPQPDWLSHLPPEVLLRVLKAEELPRGESPYVGGWMTETVTIEMHTYLDWLIERVKRLGGAFSDASVRSLDEWEAPVVNATGLRGRDLGDQELKPVRGQVILCQAMPELTQVSYDHTAAAYVVPRKDSLILGGTFQENREDLEPNRIDRNSILVRCLAMEPALRSVQILRDGVGLRPVRPTVRTEITDSPWGPRLHLNGFGGGGVSMSWGVTAEWVPKFLEAIS